MPGGGEPFNFALNHKSKVLFAAEYFTANQLTALPTHRRSSNTALPAVSTIRLELPQLQPSFSRSSKRYVISAPFVSGAHKTERTRPIAESALAPRITAETPKRAIPIGSKNVPMNAPMRLIPAEKPAAEARIAVGKSSAG